MDLIQLISSVSKVAIGAFVITLLVVGYEVMLLMRRRQEEHVQHDQNINLPDFNKTRVQDSAFNPIDVDPSATQPIEYQSRKISRMFLRLFLVLIVIIVLVTGYIIYDRNQLSLSIPKIPMLNKRIEITPRPLSPIPTQSQTSVSVTSAEPSVPAGTAVSVPPAQVSKSPTTQPKVPTITTRVVSPTSTVIAPTRIVSGAVTARPTSAGLPQAGSYQITLAISAVAIIIVYLALIL